MPHRRVVRATEPEFRTQVVSWFNEFIGRGAYPFDCATGESGTDMRTGTGFPDAVIWLNREAAMAFATLELKTPRTPADDEELLRDAVAKAQAHRVGCFVTWNMRDAFLWHTPHAPSAIVLDQDMELRYPTLSEITSVEDHTRPDKRALLRARARQILDDLAFWYHGTRPRGALPESTFFIQRLHEAVTHLAPLATQEIQRRVASSRTFRQYLYAWADRQHLDRSDEDEFYDKVAHQVVYRLIGKIIFYQALRRRIPSLEELQLRGTAEQIYHTLESLFDRVRQHDYEPIYRPEFIDQITLGELGATELIELTETLNYYDFSHLRTDVIGYAFEKLIPPEERHQLGQYFTPIRLVDLIVAFALQERDGSILDPACGSGTFLLRSYDRLGNLEVIDHGQRLALLWGIDIAGFPAELAMINLYSRDIDNWANIPRIMAEDFFALQPGQTIDLPVPVRGIHTPDHVTQALPRFKVVVANPPYIEQRNIEATNPGFKDHIARAVERGWAETYRSESVAHQPPRLRRTADIYAHFFLHAANFLEPGGRLGFVTSNAWLNAAYGHELQKFFCHHCKIVAILESRCEMWFEDAAINTVIAIVERCGDPTERRQHSTKFVKLKRPLK